MRRAGLALALTCLGCASLPIRPQDAAALAEADRQVLAGCYDCLLAARSTYERIGVGRARPLVINRLFEVQVLITLRERELALDWEDSRRRADVLAAELPTAAGDRHAPPPVIDGRRVLALADLVPPEHYGWPVATALAYRERLGAPANVPAELEWLEAQPVTPAFRDYLRFSIECSSSRALLKLPTRPVNRKPELPAGAPPLVAYRHAMCGSVDEPALRQVREDVATFVEVSGQLGRLAVPDIERTGDLASALAEIQPFHQRFPTSSAATYLFGTLHQTAGDCEAALPFYEETLGLRPNHEQALVARTVCLSHLGRHEPAEAAAGAVIDQPTADRREGFFWRAWNRWMLKRPADARADVEEAKRLGRNGAVLTLAGAIELDQNDLPTAETDLRRAVSLAGPGTNCEAHWYLGHVYERRASLDPAATQYESAMGCYQARQLAAELEKQALAERTDIDAAFRARKLAALDAKALESAGQSAASAFNGARLALQMRDMTRARRLIDIAATDQTIAPQVAELRKYLEGN